MTQKLASPDEKLVRFDSLDDIPAAPPLSEAFKAQSDDDANEDDIWPTAEERAANIAQASHLKEAALAGGLRFEAYLPSELAVWFLEMIEGKGRPI